MFKTAVYILPAILLCSIGTTYANQPYIDGYLRNSIVTTSKVHIAVSLSGAVGENFYFQKSQPRKAPIPSFNKLLAEQKKRGFAGDVSTRRLPSPILYFSRQVLYTNVYRFFSVRVPTRKQELW